MQALAASLVVVAAGLQAQKAPRDMDRFIDQLMKKMTLEEKIGQLGNGIDFQIKDHRSYLLAFDGGIT